MKCLALTYPEYMVRITGHTFSESGLYPSSDAAPEGCEASPTRFMNKNGDYSKVFLLLFLGLSFVVANGNYVSFGNIVG